MRVFTINAGYFHCDGGAMFGVVPKKVWSKRYPCNEDNYCRMVMRCLFIDTGDRRILIDTGCGTKQLNYLKFYGVSEIVDFNQALSELGYSCADVTDVILTHLHFDHCGGCVERDDANGDLRLVFPNAMHWVGEAQWNNFLNSNVREANSYFQDNMMPVYEAGKLKLLSADYFLLPNVELRLCNGHTKGQISVVVHGDVPDDRIMYLGDVIPTATSIPLAWVSAYDTDPIVSMKEKELFLKEASEGNYSLCFVHDAYCEYARIKEIGGKYRLRTSS